MAAAKKGNLLDEEDDDSDVESPVAFHEEVLIQSDRHLGTDVAEKVMGKDKPDNKKYQDYDDSFGTYVWDSATGKFFGRTGIAWIQLIVFYTIFYIGLASFFGLCFYLFAQTLEDSRPKWILGESLIGTNPGLGYRPLPPETDSTILWYNRQKDSEVRFWYSQLSAYVENIDKPSPSDDLINCDYNGTKANKERCCRIDTTDYGSECTKANKFGYAKGDPCILLKLNKIFGWEPQGYGINSKGRFDAAQFKTDLDKAESLGMPASLRQNITDGLRLYPNNKEDYLSTVWISCEGETGMDKESIEHLEYYHPNKVQGIPGFYFPYYKQNGYQSPFIFVQFINPKKSVLINVECKAWANNIHHDRQFRLGSVHFELLID